MREKKLPSQTLPDFQQYLLSRKLVPEKSVTFYAYWANRYLTFSKRLKNADTVEVWICMNMGSGNRNKVFFSFLGRTFFQLLVMAEGRQAVLLTIYINFSPNLRENDSRWQYCKILCCQSVPQNHRKGKSFKIGYNYFYVTSPRGSSISLKTALRKNQHF